MMFLLLATEDLIKSFIFKLIRIQLKLLIFPRGFGDTQVDIVMFSGFGIA